MLKIVLLIVFSFPQPQRHCPSPASTESGLCCNKVKHLSLCGDNFFALLAHLIPVKSGFLTVTAPTVPMDMIAMSIDMSKLATGEVLVASSGTIDVGLLTRLSPNEWIAIGVLSGIAAAIITLLIN